MEKTPWSSQDLFKEALSLFPGGVNSPVRASVKPYPFYVKRAKGAYLYTVDGLRLIDYVLAYGPLILGHANDRVLNSVSERIKDGWIFGTPNELEVMLAKELLNIFSHHSKVRFVNSGTEACMLALRLARAYKKRDTIIKFDGSYHGFYDSFLVKAGSAITQYSVPSSEGIVKNIVKHTLSVPFNDIDALERIVKERGKEIAAIIMEPVMANCGLIIPEEGYIKEVRRVTYENDILLIADEVVTGFRLGLKGAQGYYGFNADITVLGKVLGGGFPIGAVLSSDEVMDNLTPLGGVFNAGTFNAHPVSMVAGLETLKIIKEEACYKIADQASKKVSLEMEDILSKRGYDVCVNSISSMFQVFFKRGFVRNYQDALSSDSKIYVSFHESLIKSGIFIPPSQMETCFTSSSHNEEILEETMRALEDTVKGLR